MQHQKYEDVICGLINENNNALHSYQKYDEGIESL